MNFISNILGLKNRDFIFIRIFLYVLFYVSIYSIYKLLLFPFLIIFGITIYAYQREKSKVNNSYDHFEDDNLFFRYGTKISGSIFPLRYSRQLDNEETKNIIFKLQKFLISALESEIDYRIERGEHKTEMITIADRNRTSDQREFLKFSFRGKRGGELTHFLLFEFLGSYTIIHFDSYIKGIPHWYNKADFLLRSPFRIWFWIVPYLRNDYSILAVISKYLDNSFEEYDVNTYYSASKYSILDSIREYLKENDLLTVELDGMINYQLIYNNNISGNQVNMNGSNNVISSIVQKAL
ncbi:MAG: hypothetical protein R2828_01475 [Saprospiraceae bacterium]